MFTTPKLQSFKNGIIAICCFTLSQISAAQNTTWLWAVHAGSAESDKPSDIATSLSGSTYLVGDFKDTMLVDTFNLSPNVPGTSDSYIAKTDASGNVQWVIKSFGNGNDKAMCVCVDQLGDIFVVGSINGTIILGSFTLVSVDTSDIYIARLDSTGAVLWAFVEGGIGWVEPAGIGTDTLGGVFLTGNYQDSVNLSNVSLVSGGSYECFIAKYDYTGSIQWAQTTGGLNSQFIASSRTDHYGNTYITGIFVTSGDFGITQLSGAPTMNIAFVASCNPLGIFTWATQIGSQNSSQGYGVSYDGLGNVYAAGMFTASVDFPSDTLFSRGGNDGYLVKFNSQGTLVWANVMGGNNIDMALNVATDAQGNSRVVGYFWSFMYFDTTTNWLMSGGLADAFVCDYDVNGNFIRSKTVRDNLYGDARCLSLDAVGNTYIAGIFEDSCDFDTLQGFETWGRTDIYLGKIGSDFISSTQNQNQDFGNVTVFPNPTSSMATVNCEDEIIKINILDLSGRVVFEIARPGLQQINLSFLDNGLYIIAVETQEYHISMPIVINH